MMKKLSTVSRIQVRRLEREKGKKLKKVLTMPLGRRNTNKVIKLGRDLDKLYERRDNIDRTPEERIY